MTNPTISGGGLAENMKRLKDACRRFQFLQFFACPARPRCAYFWRSADCSGRRGSTISVKAPGFLPGSSVCPQCADGSSASPLDLGAAIMNAASNQL